MILEKHGRFWWHHEPIPEGCYAPDNSVTGTMKIDDTGRTTVDFHGALQNTKQKVEVIGASSQSGETPSIQGILTKSGRHVILNQLSRTSLQFARHGHYESYSAAFCLVGDAIVPAAMEEMAISQIAVNLEGYEEWLHLSSIDYARTDEGFTATFKKNDTISYSLDDGVLQIRYDLYAPFCSRPLQKLDAREVASFIYTQVKPASIKEAIQRYQLIQDFLILITNSGRMLEQPTVRLDGVDGDFTLYFQRNKSEENGPGIYEAWIEFPELKPDLGTVFAAWKAKRETFGPAFYLYLGTRRGQAQYIENRFLNLIFGLEAFCRQKFPQLAITSKLQEKIDRIISQVEREKDKDWLRRRLEAASLSDRLFRIFTEVPFSQEQTALRSFTDDCAKRRNDISHFGGRRDGGDYVEFINEVYSRSEVASLFYQALILKEIGIKDEQLKWWYQNSPKAWPLEQYMQMFGLWKEPEPSGAPPTT